MKRCVIIGSAQIDAYEKIIRLFRTDDCFVYCDGGLYHQERLGRAPDLIVGDFDSYSGKLPDGDVITLPCVKDDTDTFAAVKEMLQRGYRDFLLVGVCGQRIDHTLSNLSILLYLDRRGAAGEIADDYSRMTVLKQKPVSIAKGSCSFFSIHSLSGDLKGVNIQGAKYNLTNAVVPADYQFAVSNEVAEDEAVVWIDAGTGLLTLVD